MEEREVGGCERDIVARIGHIELARYRWLCRFLALPDVKLPVMRHRRHFPSLAATARAIEVLLMFAFPIRSRLFSRQLARQV